MVHLSRGYKALRINTWYNNHKIKMPWTKYCLQLRVCLLYIATTCINNLITPSLANLPKSEDVYCLLLQYITKHTIWYEHVLDFYIAHVQSWLLNEVYHEFLRSSSSILLHRFLTDCFTGVYGCTVHVYRVHEKRCVWQAIETYRTFSKSIKSIPWLIF